MIKDLPASDRPRERMWRLGPAALSDYELLAILLGTSGVKGKSVLEVAKDILSHHGSLRRVAEHSLSDWQQIKGLGKVKTATLAAAFELARRVTAERDTPLRFRSAKEVADYFRPSLGHLKKEVFKVLLLDAKSKLLSNHTIAMGNIHNLMFSPRDVFYPAINESAGIVIFLHNHPSGDPTPSDEDIEMTKRLVEGGRILGITVVDHIIIGEDRHISLLEEDREMFVGSKQ